MAGSGLEGGVLERVYHRGCTRENVLEVYQRWSSRGGVPEGVYHRGCTTVSVLERVYQKECTRGGT